MRNDQHQYLTNLDTATERYTLVHPFGEGWFARMETKMADGTWHTAWYSETFPNQYGARKALTDAFGL